MEYDLENQENQKFGRRFYNCMRYHWRGICIVAVPILLMPLLFLEPVKPLRCLYLILLMVFYWFFEVIPLYATAMIPITLLPAMGILKSNDACMGNFTDGTISLFGAFVVAATIEYSKLHKRIALSVIETFGSNPKFLHMLFTIVAMFLSILVTNSITVACLFPIVKAVLEQLAEEGVIKLETEKVPKREDDPPFPSKCAICFYLGVAYSATIGGCASIIGSDTNTTFKRLYETRFPNETLSIWKFLFVNLPPVLVVTALTWLWLQYLYMGFLRPSSAAAADITFDGKRRSLTLAAVRTKKEELGPLNVHEIQVIIMVVILVILLFGRSPGFFTGWADFLNAKLMKNSWPLILVVCMFFILPINCLFMKYFVCRRPDTEHTIPTLINWKYIQHNVQWGLLFLYGTSYVMSDGIKASGLDRMVGDWLSGMKSLPGPMIQIVFILLAIILTNCFANIAVCLVMIPVLMEMAITFQMHPLYLTLPACMAFSNAFLFPISTPPNGIAYAYGNVRTGEMLLAGIGPTICSLLVFGLSTLTWAHIVFEEYDHAM